MGKKGGAKGAGKNTRNMGGTPKKGDPGEELKKEKEPIGHRSPLSREKDKQNELDKPGLKRNGRKKQERTKLCEKRNILVLEV